MFLWLRGRASLVGVGFEGTVETSDAGSRSHKTKLCFQPKKVLPPGLSYAILINLFMASVFSRAVLDLTARESCPQSILPPVRKNRQAHHCCLDCVQAVVIVTTTNDNIKTTVEKCEGSVEIADPGRGKGGNGRKTGRG